MYVFAVAKLKRSTLFPGWTKESSIIINPFEQVEALVLQVQLLLSGVFCDN